MNYMQNLLRFAVIAILTFFAFGPSHPGQATQTETEPFSCTNVTEIPQIECEALVALYHGMDGPNWSNNRGWLETNTPCDWYGITCRKENISQLKLSGSQSYPFGLQGDVPTEIGNLSNLNILELSSNQLSSLPAEIGNLNDLWTLHLGDNQLSSLPVEISNLNNLIELYIPQNRLNRLPSEIGSLKKLSRLDLFDNQLSSLPSEIGNLNELSWLELSNNQLSNLPPEIGNLQLGTLGLAYNQLSSLPAEIGNINNLYELFLHNNNLSNLPVEINNLNNLDSLSLVSNQLSSLPVGIANLSNLDWLSVAYNRLAISDDNLRTFLTAYDFEWGATQTIAPEGVQAIVLGMDRIEMTWAPIAFQDKDGYYEISIAEGGPFTVHGTTRTKSDNRYIINDLTKETSYEIRIRTYTSSHKAQSNQLWSAYSPIISATTSRWNKLFLPLISQ